MTDIDYTANLSGSLKLSAAGEWFHNGVRFQNAKLAALFHRSIVWDEKEHSYFVQIGRQRATFECEDTAYFVVALNETSFPCRITLSDGSEEELSNETLSTSPAGQIYCTVKKQHRARFARNVHQEMAGKMTDGENIVLAGHKIKIAGC